MFMRIKLDTYTDTLTADIAGMQHGEMTVLNFRYPATWSDRPGDDAESKVPTHITVFQKGSKYWVGIGMEQGYSGAEIVTYEVLEEREPGRSYKVVPVGAAPVRWKDEAAKVAQGWKQDRGM